MKNIYPYFAAAFVCFSVSSAHAMITITNGTDSMQHYHIAKSGGVDEIVAVAPSEVYRSVLPRLSIRVRHEDGTFSSPERARNGDRYMHWPDGTFNIQMRNRSRGLSY